jgi:polyphosphate glucokinase
VPNSGPLTLTIDIGGTGLKAAVLNRKGAMLSDRLRVETAYPMPPEKLLADIVGLIEPLPAADRGSAGFPGMVRGGRVLTAPMFSTEAGPGTNVDDDLVDAWNGFDLAAALSKAVKIPFRVANDADVQGSAVISGKGVEMVITLGTGFGTALFEDGRLLPHLELAHHPMRDDQTYNEYVGEVARKMVGPKRWNRRVRRAIGLLDALVFYDHLYIGGGNAKRIDFNLGDKVTIVDNTAGLLGGIALWESHSGNGPEGNVPGGNGAATETVDAQDGDDVPPA